MKTSVFSKCLFMLVLLLTGSLAMSAVTPKDYMYDTKEENGKIVSKVVFVNDNGFLKNELKYEFAYNADGKVSEKKAYRWDKGSEEWTPFYLISYTYDNQNGEIHSEYGMWDKKKKNYTLNIQNMVDPAASYDEIFS